MPFTQSNEVEIFYYLEGDGPPLLLHHGFTGSHEGWRRRGYVDVLKEKYRLILVDARGHGLSGKPQTPEAYSSELMVNDIVAVLDDLGIEKAHFYGYSLGGRIGWATGRYAPDRFSSLILGGIGPNEKDSVKTKEEYQGFANIIKQGVEALIVLIENVKGASLEDWGRNVFLNLDLGALIAYSSYFENIGFADYLPTLTTACFLYAGEMDDDHASARECAKVVRNASFVSLPGFNHYWAFNSTLARDLIIPHVLKFLDSLSHIKQHKR